MDLMKLREALGVDALRGHDTSTLDPPSNLVRMFISSTISDLNTERNAFWEKAYPELQKYCQSLGLVFEALVGSQYGHRPIPRLISETEFELLLSKLSRDQEGLKVLKKWFIKDDNSVPPKYVLQPITTHYPYCNDTKPEATPQHDADILSWNLTEARLLQLLCSAALQAEKDGDFSAEQKHNFFMSLTEREMEQSFLSSQDQGKTSSVIFVRELPHLKKSESHKHAKFLDVTADGLLDTEAQELLSNLKLRISSARSSHLTLELSKNAMDVNRKEHKEYLERFCEQIVCQIKDRIARQTAPPAAPEWLWFQQELYHHAKLCKYNCAHFTGRDGPLAKLCLTMWESRNIQHVPLVVYGPPEVGKTALMCKLAHEVRTGLDPQAVVVLRLLGTSPISSDVDSVLKGICLQVCGALGLATPSPQTANTHEKLVRFFHAMLQKVSEEGETLVLILDSLDDLSRANNGHKLHWLPTEIPPNVHFVVSTLHDMSPLKRLKALLRDDKCFFEVEPMNCDQGQDIINDCLNVAGRKIASEQTHAIIGGFQKSGSLLHLRLMVDMAKQWSSYTSTSAIHLGSSVQELISLFLQTLEKKHGEKLVHHALGYITLSRRGLSEAELRDVLSVDNDVLAEVYQTRLPPSPTLIRFPPLLWARLRHDLKDHLVERWENGIIVLVFSRRQFTNVVKARYLSVEHRIQMHSVLSEYFSGQWSQGQLKPILLSPLSTQLNADRKVPHQPMWYAKGMANLRMLHELPYHLIHAGQWEELRHSLLGNLDWLYCKTLSCGVASVIQDLSLCVDIIDCPEIQLIRDCFLLLKPTLDFIDGHTDSAILFTEITARLQALAPVYPSLIGQLCSQCDDWFASYADPVLVPKSGFLQPPGGPLINTLSDSAQGITTVDLYLQRDLLIAGSVDGELVAWDLKCLEMLHTIEGHTGNGVCSLGNSSTAFQLWSRYNPGLLIRSLCLSLKQWSCQTHRDKSRLMVHYLMLSFLDLLHFCALQKMKPCFLQVWGLVTGHLLDSFSGIGSPVTFVSVYNNTVISASTRSGHIKLWQLDYDPKHKIQTGIPANCPRVVISKDGNTVHFIREEARAKVFTWNNSEGMSSDTMDVSSEVCCMELAQQKQLLFCGLCTGTVLIYPLTFPQETLCLPPPESLPTVLSMAISPREDKIAVAYEDMVCLFEITARDSFPCVEGPIHNYSLSLLHSPVSAMGLLPDYRLLYGTFGGEVAIYDFKSGMAAELDHHGSAITCIALSNWDKHALVGSEDCVQKLWNLSPVLLDHSMEYKVGFYFEGILCAAFSVNDKYVFTGSRDKTIKVWDVSTGSLLYIQYVYAAVIRITPYKDGFVAISQLGSFIKEGFRCPNTLSQGYNPLRNFRAHYRVTSREKSGEAPHSVTTGLHNYNPAQFNFMNIIKTKQSSTCVLL
ncbi:NACHT domain- and WD repeat-containing protein 1 [Clarias magur]|uniref:NACHT domain- and WD repeat-containing protein 1 n=1 Tax=Clarias magur TaxID=1594786 RepID=A0A8J5BNJ4_CLAMG|nr:NACHT domain- and WD repeat-containing protein 1 [Clarias magur]